MAMQAALSSRLLILGGAGYFGTVLFKKGKLSDLIGELQALLKGIEGGDTDGESGHADAIAQQVSRLAQEVRQLASQRQITVVNGNGQSGNLTALIIPGAAIGVAGYGYMRWKGMQFSDLMYVTKRNMTAAVANLTKHLEDVTGALAKAKEHLTQRIQGLDDKMDVQKEISKAIQNDVNTINENIQLLDSDLFNLQRIVSGLDGKIGTLENKQDLANLGITYLCHFAQGKKLAMPKELKDQVASGKNRITFHQDAGGLKALIDDSFCKLVTENLARTASVPKIDAVQVNNEEPSHSQTPREPLLRFNSAKC